MNVDLARQSAERTHGDVLDLRERLGPVSAHVAEPKADVADALVERRQAHLSYVEGQLRGRKR